MTAVDFVSAGWYQDPADSSRVRWWDGVRWTEHVYDWAAAGLIAPVGDQTTGPTIYASRWQAAPGYGVAGLYQAPAFTVPAGGCQECGAVPALETTFGEHHGMVFLWQQVTYTGQWCRACGLARFRHAQSRTLLLGWWGFISFFLTLLTIAFNGARYLRLRNLAAPSGRLAAGVPQVRSVFASPGFALCACASLFALYQFLL